MDSAGCCPLHQLAEAGHHFVVPKMLGLLNTAACRLLAFKACGVQAPVKKASLLVDCNRSGHSKLGSN